MPAVWFTSDLHFGHRLVARHRGFSEDVEKHDTALIERWHKRVHADDQVWVLGDIAVSAPARSLAIIAELPGHKHLVAGNHDNCHPMHRQSFKEQAKFLAVFESVQSAARRRIEGASVLLSHFPYSADRGEMRYPQWRLPDLGEWLLHGHTHSTERRTSAREIHVGVDAWDLRPANLGEIQQMMLA